MFWFISLSIESKGIVILSFRGNFLREFEIFIKGLVYCC